MMLALERGQDRRQIVYSEPMQRSVWMTTRNAIIEVRNGLPGLLSCRLSPAKCERSA